LHYRGWLQGPGSAVRAAELFNEGWAPLLVVTGYQQLGLPKSEAELFADIAISRGVPEKAILREPYASNTGLNISLSQKLLESHGVIPKTVILVHKPYMSRRFLATAEAQWRGSNPHFIVQHEHTSFETYAEKNGYRDTVYKLLGDFGRMSFYVEKGFQSFQHIPDEIQAAYDTLLSRGYTTR
jgi:uncharacterized SAM-binding protein YcdF (DUF218 family)